MPENPYQSPVDVATAEEGDTPPVASLWYRLIPTVLLMLFGALSTVVALVAVVSFFYFIVEAKIAEVVAHLPDFMMIFGAFAGCGGCWISGGVCCWLNKWKEAAGLAIIGPILPSLLIYGVIL